MSIQLAIIVIYIILLFAISAYAKTKAKGDSVNFLFSGRKLTTPLVAVTVAGLAVGAASTVGVAENAFTVGVAAGWYNAAWSAGALAMGLVAAGKYRQLNCTTIPELFERYYDVKSRFISVFCLIIIQLVITSMQYIAGGAILSSVLPDIFSFNAGMITSAVVFIGITLIGGLWSSGLSNLLSVALIYIGVIVGTFLIVGDQGGLAVIASKLPTDGPGWFTPFGGLGIPLIIGWAVVMISQAISAQSTVQIACGAQSSKAARNGFIWGAIIIFPIGFFSAVMGLAAKVAFPDVKATLALPKIIMSLDPIISGITLAALWAADVSTACTLLLGAGTLFAQDLYKRFFNPSISESKYMLINRLSILILGIFTLWLAFNAVGIVKTLLIGLSLTTAFTLVFLATVFTPGLCRKGSAFYTVLAGVVTLIAWMVFPETRIFSHPIYMEWMVCVIVFLLIAIFDKRKIST